jgi:methylglutaconyl-CoA hydratase
LLSCGPEASGAAKRLIDAVWTLDRDAARRYVIEAIVAARSGAEGQEGMRAFLEKREPRWAE